jgi:ABC-type Fe3+-hydroxamate transport system substrate-binding protein
LSLFLWARPTTPGAPSQLSTSPQAARLVSLAPAVTETLRALGAEAELVAISDYCPTVGHLPRVGSAITPHYEAIARAKPTLILATAVSGSQLTPLDRIAPTVELPWLTVEEVASSVERLGALSARKSQAQTLAARFRAVLTRAAPAGAPRVLALLGDSGAGSRSYWFIKDDSLHGALLRAAGGQNAIPGPVPGAPRLSVEELLRLDPDVIVLFGADARGPSAAEPLLADLRQLTPLRAVRAARLGALSAPELMGAGPDLLDFVEPLRAEIQRLLALGAP